MLLHKSINSFCQVTFTDANHSGHSCLLSVTTFIKSLYTSH